MRQSLFFVAPKAIKQGEGKNEAERSCVEKIIYFCYKTILNTVKKTVLLFRFDSIESLIEIEYEEDSFF